MTPVSSKTIVGVFSNAGQARAAVEELRRAGYRQDSISLVIRPEGSGETGKSSEVVKDAELGAAAGGIGGALLAAVAVPGLGTVLAMGPIVAALSGAGLGAVTGGLIGAFTDAGVPAAKASEYAEQFHTGADIVAVRTDDAGAEQAFRIMQEHDAVNVEPKADAFRDHRVKQTAGDEPLSEDELRRQQVWPYGEAHDIGEDLVDVAAPQEEPRRR